MISPAGQIWLLREVYKQAWHSEIPAQRETVLGSGWGQENWRGRGWQLRLQSRYNTDLYIYKVIKQRQAELKGHFGAATW